MFIEEINLWNYRMLRNAAAIAFPWNKKLKESTDTIVHPNYRCRNFSLSALWSFTVSRIPHLHQVMIRFCYMLVEQKGGFTLNHKEQKRDRKCGLHVIKANESGVE